MSEYSKERVVKNGLDIMDVFGPYIGKEVAESIISSTAGFTHTLLVSYLNDNGFDLAAQALDDLWHPRDEQWWRDDDEFDGRYLSGDEKRDQIFGRES